MPRRTPENPDSDFFPIDPTPSLWRGWRGSVAIITALTLVAGVFAWLTHHTPTDTRCAKDNPDLHWTGRGEARECIGVLTEHPYAFDPALAEIIGLITKENYRVRQDWEDPDLKTPYVKIAVVLPMTGSDTTALPISEIIKSLKGAYTAQCRANQCAGLPGKLSTGLYAKVPHFQLVLANMGARETYWKTIAGQLAEMTSDKSHPLIAATGLGISIPETKQAAIELSKRDIPTVTAVVSADDINAPQLFKVSPSNQDYVKAITKYLETRPDLTQGCLIYDSKQEDNFTRTLKNDFDRTFKGEFRGNKLCTAAFAGKTVQRNRAVTGLFPPAIDNICKTKANAVLYAGRSRDLPDFLDALTKRDPQCARRPITVLTGSTGLWGAGQYNAPVLRGKGRGDSSMSQKLADSKTSLVNASATDPHAWIQDPKSSDTPNGFEDFYKSFLGLGFSKQDLETGYGILHYDAVATAEIAAQSFTVNEHVATPNAADVADALVNLHTAHSATLAGGDLEFDGFNNGKPHKKPVPIILVPDPRKPRAWDLYKTP
ncbi:ABC transporter substrate-binding protein [Streptomyces sp. NPDC003710]